jgi:hypothetical protein
LSFTSTARRAMLVGTFDTCCFVESAKEQGYGHEVGRKPQRDERSNLKENTSRVKPAFFGALAFVFV